MKEDLKKQVWVKRTFAIGDTSKPYRETKGKIKAALNGQQFNTDKGYPPMFYLDIMPWWYSVLRYIQDNYKQFIWGLIVVVFTSILGAIASKYIK
ncbi:MAG: hypothetical protein ABIN91_19100 [Mucilaginibacter sp.]|uniref:hypothetical protein n=1 Tax=Mucilaginibacter sp. TaxID=1882438 RepID=UPI003263270A